MSDDARILIVDDEIGIIKLLEITLRKEHFTQIVTATSKEEALQALTVNDFDVILLDVMLPDGDGFTLCSAIRQLTTQLFQFYSLAPVLVILIN